MRSDRYATPDIAHPTRPTSMSIEPEIADVSTVPQINTKHIAGLQLPRPPVAEQRKIVAMIDGKCEAINALIRKAEEVTATLREYRSALITDAVTGKIDVRGVA